MDGSMPSRGERSPRGIEASAICRLQDIIKRAISRVEYRARHWLSGSTAPLRLPVLPGPARFSRAGVSLEAAT
jgi:hypothetical protein